MRESAFIVGIFAGGLVLGYLAGTQREAAQNPFPSNYDSARAVCSDALAKQKEQTDTCWKATVEFLKAKHQEVTP